MGADCVPLYHGHGEYLILISWRLSTVLVCSIILVFYVLIAILLESRRIVCITSRVYRLD